MAGCSWPAVQARCSDEPSGAKAVAKAMSRLAVLKGVLSDVSSQLQDSQTAKVYLGDENRRLKAELKSLPKLCISSADKEALASELPDHLRSIQSELAAKNNDICKLTSLAEHAMEALLQERARADAAQGHCSQLAQQVNAAEANHEASTATLLELHQLAVEANPKSRAPQVHASRPCRVCKRQEKQRLCQYIGFEAATPGSAAGAKTSLKGHLKLLHCRKQGNKAKDADCTSEMMRLERDRVQLAKQLRSALRDQPWLAEDHIPQALEPEQRMQGSRKHHPQAGTQTAELCRQAPMDSRDNLPQQPSAVRPRVPPAREWSSMQEPPASSSPGRVTHSSGSHMPRSLRLWMQRRANGVSQTPGSSLEGPTAHADDTACFNPSGTRQLGADVEWPGQLQHGRPAGAPHFGSDLEQLVRPQTERRAARNGSSVSGHRAARKSVQSSRSSRTEVPDAAYWAMGQPISSPRPASSHQDDLEDDGYRTTVRRGLGQPGPHSALT
ncbi:hypothetical protein WJX84_003788 [Apatococcus fuscideae]|uniref:Uncharacterized protein n=1 Tax=Apatococcus fuscideae TaxID=2026836 RepID=A0AAW1TAY9_9CHLO